MSNKVIFKTENICKSFLLNKAVDKVSIEIYSGEVRGLIGENGSGKSTFVSLITGILQPDDGKMFFNGKEHTPKNQLDSNKSGISIIVQEMSTLDGLTVAENIFLGNEKEFVVGGIVNKRKMNKKAKSLLDEYKVTNIDPGMNVAFLSFEERKMVELVKAVCNQPSIFIVDETTTALSQEGRVKLFEVINNLKKQGCATIFITHDLEELMGICDTITVLRDGEFVETIENKKITEHDLKTMMVGRELEHKYYREDYDEHVMEEPVLKIRELFVEGVLDDINFELFKGEILGIGGLTNSGMHELGKVLFGAEKPQKGWIEHVDSGKKIGCIRDSIAKGIGYVSKNRDQEALTLLASIKDNICLPSLDKIKNAFHISKGKEEKFSEAGAKRLNVKMSSIDQFTLFLSGGNKQKVALAKWLSRGSDILILDCPTRGIDVMVKASIYTLMQELKASGKSIIMISEEILELIGMCDRILILKNGKNSAEFLRNSDLSEETVIKYMI